MDLQNITFLDGLPVDELSDSDIFLRIAREEQDIKSLESIANKPARLTADIAARKAVIAQLIQYLDAQDGSAPAIATEG